MKKILATILACSCVLSVSACDITSIFPFGEDGKDKNEIPQGDVLFADFETWAPNFQLCRISTNFGKVSINSEEEYVKTGKHSARIDPVGNGWMYFSTFSEKYEYDYTDFTHVDCIRMEMYNPQETEETVSVGLVSEPYALDQFNRAGGKEFTLKPGWNTLNYYIDPVLVSVIADLSNIRGIYMIFDPLFLYEITDTTPRYYLDTIRFRYKEEAHNATSSFEFEENKIMDFEKFYESNFYLNEFGIDMKMVKPTDYGVNSVSGSKALRMVFPATATGSWRYYFEMVGPYIQKSPLGSLTDQQFETGYFCWDVYNGHDSSYNIVAIFENATGKNEYKLATFPKSGEWTSFRVKLTDIEEAMPGWKESIGDFALSILDNQNVQRELIVDNFHLEFDE